MRGGRLLVLAALAVLVVPGVSVAAVLGSPVIEAELAEDRLVPGEEGTLDLVLVNEGEVTSGSNAAPSLNSEVTTARGLTVRVKPGSAPLTVVTGTQALGSLPEGATDPIPIRVAVPDDADPGRYQLEVRLEYVYTDYISEGDGSRDQEHVTRTVRVPVRIEDGARPVVERVTSNATVGSTDTVALRVRNAGTQTGNATRLVLTSDSADVSVGGTSAGSRYVGSWAPNETVTVRYRTSTGASAGPGSYPFTLSATYEGDDGRDRQSAGVSLAVPVRGERQFGVVSTETGVSVDDTGRVTVTLRNRGPSAVRDATVTLSVPGRDLTIGGGASTTRYVGEWPAGADRTVTVDATASADAEPRAYAVTAAVSYEDREGDSGRAEGLSASLRPRPERTFAVADVESTVRVGDDGVIRGRLGHAGNGTVENVVLEWTGEHRTLSPTETDYAVGDVAAGGSVPFAFDVSASDSAAAQPRQFSFVAVYETSDGTRRRSDPLTVRQPVRPERDEFEIDVRRATVAAGSGTTVELRITNRGNETLTDVSGKVFAESPVSTTDSEAFVAGLDPGESATLRFGVRAAGGALAKSYPLSLDFRYEEPDGDSVVSDTYRIPLTVRESDGGGVPVAPVVGVLVVLVVAALVYRRRR